MTYYELLYSNKEICIVEPLEGEKFFLFKVEQSFLKTALEGHNL